MDQVAGSREAAQPEQRRILARRGRSIGAVHTDSTGEYEQYRQTEPTASGWICGSDGHLFAAALSLLLLRAASSVVSICWACSMYSLTALPVRSASLALSPAMTSRWHLR